MLLILIHNTAMIVNGEITFQHHFQMNLGGLFVMYLISLLNLCGILNWSEYADPTSFSAFLQSVSLTFKYINIQRSSDMMDFELEKRDGDRNEGEAEKR